MLHKIIAFALMVVLSQVFSVGARAQTSGDTGATEQIKSKVARLGVGEKARATVRMKDGTKHKGYIAQARETDFVLRDRTTDAAMDIAYADVAKVENNRGHSTARNLALGIGIGVGAVVIALGILIARID
jgi:hypothetical protein